MENTKKTGLEIKEQAYRWHLLLEDGSASTAQRREFETWLRQDPRHRDAYERAAVAWEAFARLKRSDLGLNASANDSLKPEPDNPPSRLRALREKRHRPALRVAVPLAAAAAIAAISRPPALSAARSRPTAISNRTFISIRPRCAIRCHWRLSLPAMLTPAPCAMKRPSVWRTARTRCAFLWVAPLKL